MQRNASQSNPQIALPDSSTVHIRRQHEAQYQRVYDQRKRQRRQAPGNCIPSNRTHPNRVSSDR